MGAKLSQKQWADSDSDEESPSKKRNLRSQVVTPGSEPQDVMEGIRMRANFQDNSVSDGRYGRDQEENIPKNNIRQRDDGPTFQRGLQVPGGREEQVCRMNICMKCTYV
jgi:hypothetical protein